MEAAEHSWQANLNSIAEDWRFIYENPHLIRASLTNLRETIDDDNNGLSDNDRADLLRDVSEITMRLKYLDKNIAKASTYNHPLMEPFTKVMMAIGGRGNKIQRTAKNLLKDLTSASGNGQATEQAPVLT